MHDVNAQSLLSEIDRLKHEINDYPHADLLRVEEYRERLKGEEYLKLGYEKVANELHVRVTAAESENNRLQDENQRVNNLLKQQR
jgi:hypothetical protein